MAFQLLYHVGDDLVRFFDAAVALLVDELVNFGADFIGGVLAAHGFVYHRRDLVRDLD